MTSLIKQQTREVTIMVIFWKQNLLHYIYIKQGLLSTTQYSHPPSEQSTCQKIIKYDIQPI